MMSVLVFTSDVKYQDFFFLRYSLSVFLVSFCLSSQSDDGSGDLRIKNVQIWHEGRYTCTAQTVVDSDTAYADLKIVGQYLHSCQRALVFTNKWWVAG